MRNEQQLRAWLESRRDELRRQVGRIETDIRHQQQILDINLSEQAIELENDDVLAALDESGRNELQRIEHALARMKTGEYGLCVSCGEPISNLRLKSLPFAERCILCAETLGAG